MHIATVGSCGDLCKGFVVYNTVGQGVGKDSPYVEMHYIWEVV